MATGQMIFLSGDGYVSVVKSGQTLMVLVGLLWLVLAMARPGLIAEGSGWAADVQVRRWRNLWVWGILIAAAFVWAGQFTPAMVGALITSLGYFIWVVIFGRDVANLVSRFGAKTGRFSEFKKALDQLAPVHRNGTTLVFVAYIALILMLLVVPCVIQGQLTGRQLSATILGLSFGLQILLIIRVLFENLVVENSICPGFDWSDPGTIASAVVLSLFFLALVVVSATSRSGGTTFGYGAPLIFAHILVLAGRGRRRHLGTGGASLPGGSSSDSPE